MTKNNNIRIGDLRFEPNDPLWKELQTYRKKVQKEFTGNIPKENSNKNIRHLIETLQIL